MSPAVTCVTQAPYKQTSLKRKAAAPGMRSLIGRSPASRSLLHNNSHARGVFCTLVASRRSRETLL